jgi:Ca-activated chloride channel family protein
MCFAQGTLCHNKSFGMNSSKIFTAVMFVLLVQLHTSMLRAQDDLPARPTVVTRILFVFDASQSMLGTWESDLKINIARQILIDLVDSLQNVPNLQMALRVYGHQSPVPPQDCSDTKLEVPFSQGNAARIRQKLRFITPKGTTPIAGSLALATGDFPPCSNCRNIIILITDGIEACDGDPCQVSQELQKLGIILKPFVIGIGLDPGFRKTFECVGYYYNALEEVKFKETLGFVINQVLNSTTAQVNILDEEGLPVETNVNMTFSDRYSGRIMYNYIHTMNHKGVPDTLELDHLVTYHLKIHTLPPVELDSIKLVPGKHTIIAVPAPQGYLVVKTPRGKLYEGVNLMVRKSGEMNTLNYQKIGQIEKYLTGKYDLEIPIIPKLLINGAEVLQSHTTTIELPEPGVVGFSSVSHGFGSIYELKGSGQEWIHNINPAIRQQTILMQPGWYRIVFRPAGSRQTLYTVVKDFEVKPGESINIDL